MLIYILKSAACLAILFLFYKLFLERESMHVFKRFYLLGSLVFALIVPNLVFSEYVMVEPEPNVETQQPIITNYDPIGVPLALEKDVFDIEPLLWTVYFSGLIFFGLKFLRNLIQIFLRIRKNPKFKNSSFIQVLLQEKIPPHTFFKYIFLNKSKFESKEIPKEVMLHEETHAKQKHSIDVVFIELLQVIFWINPLIYFFKKAIKLNHEFLADQAVINKNVDPVTYQNTLLSFLSSESAKKYQPALPNAINYSSIKKRFTIMKSKTSKKSILFRSLILIPLLTLLLLGFTQKKILEVYPKSIEGIWIEAKEEVTEIKIFSQNGELMVDYGDIKPQIVRNNGKFFYVSRFGMTNPIILDEDTGAIHFAKRKYIPKGTSVKESLVGHWKNERDNIKFSVFQNGNGIVWDIIKADGNPIRYYPIKKGDSYGFDYDGEFTSYKVKNGILYDSNGYDYQRISKEEEQKGTTKEQIANYNSLAKKYNAVPNKDRVIPLEDLKILELVFRKMTEDQKKEAQPFPECQVVKNVFRFKIDKQGNIKEDNQTVTLDKLNFFLEKYNSESTKKERQKTVRAYIMPSDNTKNSIISGIEEILEDYGVAQINIIGPEDGMYDEYTQDGATKEQLAEYNALAKKYNDMSRNNMRIKMSDVERLEYLYAFLNEEQKATSEAFPDFPEPPPPPDAPGEIEEEMIEMEREMARQEKAMKEQEGAMIELERTMKEKEVEMEELESNIPPPPPPPHAVPKPRENYSDNLLKAYDKYIEKADDYGKASTVYNKNRKGSVKDLEQQYEKVIKLYDKYVELAVKENLMHPQKPRAPRLKKGEKTNVPPPPPPPSPKSPLDHAIEMAKQGATFYYKKKRVSSDEAISILKKNKDLSMDISKTNDEKPVVKIDTHF